MCGIAGRFNFDQAQPVDIHRVRAMTSAVAHRGPDADGFYLSDGIGLGHRRLSIIDLSTGDQPLASEDRMVWVVFNGEIYNFAETRVELERQGHVFRTHTDTEVIVHAYEEWGEDAVHHFRGMFAFALWDERKRRLVLVRDRLGIKPLYYAVTKTGIVFGSEIKSLLEDPEVSREWSPEALDAYLALQYVPSPHTIYKGVQKLPPGHLLIAEHGRTSVRQYWDLTFARDERPRHEDEYLEQLDALVSEAVRLRLISDVPLGAFLSGGIDSSVIVSAMTAQSSGPVLTTSVGFDEHAFDELEYAHVVAQQLGTEGTDTVVQSNVIDLLPRLAWHFDEPFGDSSAVPTYYVSAAARRQVTVALSGDGGDELWAGYARHRMESFELRARRLLGPSAHLAGLLAGHLPLGIKGARSLRRLALSPADACADKYAYGLFETNGRRSLYSGDFQKTIDGANPFAGLLAAYRGCPSTDPFDRALYTDIKTSMADDILTKVDKMSMAVSLEARVPLLDHKLVEFASTVPASLKLKQGQRKYLLRRLLERRLPASIVNRPKHGFEAPIGEWLRGPLAHLVHALLLDGRLRDRGIFEESEITRLWREHRARARDHRHRLWNLVMLELWFRQFVDPAQPRRTEAAA